MIRRGINLHLRIDICLLVWSSCLVRACRIMVHSKRAKGIGIASATVWWTDFVTGVVSISPVFQVLTYCVIGCSTNSENHWLRDILVFRIFLLRSKHFLVLLRARDG